MINMQQGLFLNPQWLLFTSAIFPQNNAPTLLNSSDLQHLCFNSLLMPWNTQALIGYFDNIKIYNRL